MKQPTESQMTAIRELLAKGGEYIRANRDECNSVIQIGFAQGLNETPAWEGYRARLLEELAK